MILKCTSVKCVKANGGKPYEWDYRGENPFYATCPRCKSSIKIPRKEE